MASDSVEAGRPPIRIGCAGWSIPSVHAALFGEGESMLARYATRFDTVEINSCFYRPHRPQTYERWAATVPPEFRFSVKLPRSITHEARLVDGEDRLARFLGEIAGLGDKLGGILVQLPPSLALDVRIADDFFARMRSRVDVPIACEPRHRSWFVPDVDLLWVRYRIARVAADPARVPSAARIAGHGDWNYWRWHGSPKIYYSAYDDARLQSLAADLTVHARPGREAWCILDNTAEGHAIADAAKLQALCGVVPSGSFVPQRPAPPLQHAMRF
jgi:uncharacterized protein YecE (DUF72 family)